MDITFLISMGNSTYPPLRYPTCLPITTSSLLRNLTTDIASAPKTLHRRPQIRVVKLVRIDVVDARPTDDARRLRLLRRVPRLTRALDAGVGLLVKRERRPVVVVVVVRRVCGNRRSRVDSVLFGGAGEVIGRWLLLVMLECLLALRARRRGVFGRRG